MPAISIGVASVTFPRSAFPAIPWASFAAFALIAVSVVILLLEQAAPTLALDLGDSDNFMRLAEVRDWLGGQSWWDIRQHRVDPPFGLYTHWSRLADVPLAAGIVALRPLAGAGAEGLALVVVPLVLLVAALVLQRSIAAGLGGRGAGLAALGVGALATPMLVQFVPGRIDHHGLQIVLVLAAVAALVRVRGTRGGALAALASAVSLNVGLETAPYLAVIAAFVAGDWAWRGKGSVAHGYGLGLAIAVPLLFAVTVPFADAALAKGDAIGRGHVVVAELGGVVLAALTLAGLARSGRLAALAGLVVAIAALVATTYPELLAAPYAMVGPLLARVWMAHIVEMRSIVDEARIAQLAALGRVWFVALAAIAAVVGARSGRREAVLLALLAVAAVGLGCWQTRALALATAVVVPAAGVALAALWERKATDGSVLPFALGLLVLGHSPYTLLSTRAAAAGPVGARCNTPAALAPLAAMPRGTVLAPIDLGGSLLALTPHNVVATPIHRDVHGNAQAYAVLRAAPGAPPPGIDYLAYCPADAETGILVADAPHGLLAALVADRPPRWLVRVGSGPLALYRITR